LSRPIYDLDREHSYRFKTTYKAVQLNCLDPDRNAIDGAYGTGVIVEEESGVWLYTCWHLITGFDPARIKIPPETTIRAFLLLRLMSIENDPDSIRQTGDTQIEIVPLYLDDECKIPAWKQDAEDTPHADLNAAGLKVPKHHDSAKLKVSSKFAKSGLQTVVDTGRWPYTSEIGSPLIVVGYPYGYSTTESLRPACLVPQYLQFKIDSRI